MNPCMKLATLLKEQGLLSIQVKEKLTVNSEVVVEYLEQWERVPSVSGLLAKHLVHVYRKQRPEDLCVLNQKITKPGERLTNKQSTIQFTTIIPHQNEPNHPSRKQCRFIHRISHSYQQHMNINLHCSQDVLSRTVSTRLQACTSSSFSMVYQRL